VTPNFNLKGLIDDWRDSQSVVAAVREEETALEELPRAELAALRTQLERAFQQDEGLTLVVERVLRVYNNDTQSRFTRKRAEIAAVRGECPSVTRYHGTTQAAAAAIAREGFRLPEGDEDGDFVGTGKRVYYTEEQRHAAEEHAGDPLMFGQAIYVSKALEKATRFAQGAVILCECAAGKAMDARSAQHHLTQSELREKGFDSVRALPGCQEEGGCMYEELALYGEDQIMPTHVVHFRLVKSGAASLVAQDVDIHERVEARDHSIEGLLVDLVGRPDSWGTDIDEPRIRACKLLGDIARDDQRKAIEKFLSNRKLVAQLVSSACSSNEALQFEALRVWWNLSFNDEACQSLAMHQLGVNFLTSLLQSPNMSLRLRASGLIWNLTQHSEDNRHVFREAGAIKHLGNALAQAEQTVKSAMSPPWGTVQLVLGALANLAMSCSDQLKQDVRLMQVGQNFLAMDLVAPPAVIHQATRLICNVISMGEVDAKWQRNGYSYRSSAPREATEVC
jgi:hypothetical protein